MAGGSWLVSQVSTRGARGTTWLILKDVMRGACCDTFPDRPEESLDHLFLSRWAVYLDSGWLSPSPYGAGRTWPPDRPSPPSGSPLGNPEGVNECPSSLPLGRGHPHLNPLPEGAGALACVSSPKAITASPESPKGWVVKMSAGTASDTLRMP